jgi:hypothetical protein
MTPEQMKDALAWKQKADKLRTQLNEFVLLQRDSYTKEVVCLGEPVSYKKGEFHRVEVPIPDEVRRYAFRVWKRETTLQYNDACRKIAQLGLVTDHALRPLPEARP